MNIPHIYIISGGKGLAGENVVKSLLVQFPDFKVPTTIESDVLSEDEALTAQSFSHFIFCRNDSI